MRTIALIILFLASLSGITAHAQLKLIPKERLDSVANPPLAPNAATLKFECLRIDAGEMNETDGPVVFTYGFVNLGNVPVSISRLVSTCSCAVATASEKEIGPGEKGTITLRYNPKGHPGQFERRVFVYTDSHVQPTAVLRLAVKVRSGDGMTKDFPVQMGCIMTQKDEVLFTRGKAGAAEIRFVNLSGKKLALACEEMMLADCLDFTVEPEVVEDGQEGVMTISYDPERRHPAAGKASVLLKGLGVPPSQSTIKVILK